MEKTKKVLSLLLAATMVMMSFFCCDLGILSFNTEAAVSETENSYAFTFYVPETIYLAPNASSMTEFQYYVDNGTNGSLTANGSKTTGLIYFNCANASNVVITAKASGTSGNMTIANLGTANIASMKIGETTVTGANISSTGWTMIGGTFNQSISVGSLAAAVTENSFKFIEWTATYTIDGSAYKAYAYTTCYAPLCAANSTAAALGATGYKSTWHSENHLTVSHWITGGHSVAMGEYSTGTNPIYAGDTNGITPEKSSFSMYDPPLSDGSVTTGGAGGSDVDSSLPATGVTGTGMYCGVLKGDCNGRYLDVYGGTLYITVDTSRYTDYSQIPNLTTGIDVNNNANTNTDCTGSSNANGNMGRYVQTSTNAGVYTGSGKGTAFSGTGAETFSITTTGRQVNAHVTGTISTDMITMEAWSTGKYSSNDDAILQMQTRVYLATSAVDKTSLRAIYRASSMNVGQSMWYDGTLWSTYRNAHAAAGAVLGNPRATQGEIDSATTALTNAKAALVRLSFTATVYHKLPAMNGFTYTFNGNTYTAADGYITLTETMSFKAGNTVTASTNTYTGFYFSATAENPASQKSYQLGADVTYTFVYTANQGTITFNYDPNSSHGGFISNNSTTSKVITYGQSYGSFPTPTMDGWSFGGWYGNAACTGARITPAGISLLDANGGTLNLFAKWTCYFEGGHGSSSDPFLVATQAHLDNIDDSSVLSTSTGKYFKQTANISCSQTYTQVKTFGGNYNGQNYSISLAAESIVADAAKAAVFGTVTNASIYDLNVNMGSSMNTSNYAGANYAGFIGLMTNTSINDVQIVFSGALNVGTAAGIGYAGILAGYAGGTSSITNSSVTVSGGSFTNTGSETTADCFIGTAENTVTKTNTWTFVQTAPTGYNGATSNNLMTIGDANGTATLTKAGDVYTFTAIPSTGWSAVYKTTDTGESICNVSQYSPAPSLNAADYTIHFVKEVVIGATTGGSVTGSGSYQLNQGETVTGLAAAPTRGYHFTGWTNTTNGTLSSTTETTVSYTMGTNAGAVTANFVLNTYTVAYNANAGTDQVSVPAATVYTYNDPITIAGVPVRPGYIFTKWNTAADGTGTSYTAQEVYTNLTDVNEATVTLYAQWTRINYSVTFHVNNGTAVQNLPDVAYGTTIIMPETTRTGYLFGMWYENDDFTGNSYPAGSSKNIYASLNLYAKWTPITYTITFNSSKVGTTNLPAVQTVAYSETPSFGIPTLVPVCPGWNFVSWNSAEAGNGVVYHPGDTITSNLRSVQGENVNLYAQWTAAQFTITWNLTGGTLNNETTVGTTTVTFGGRYTIPTGTLKKSGYSFVGWFSAETGGTQITNESIVEVTDNTTYYAQWTYSTYKVVFNANGSNTTGEMADINCTYNETYVIPANEFVRAGYNFMGWGLTADAEESIYNEEDQFSALTGEENGIINLYAIWAPKTYSVSYNKNGGTGSMSISSVKMGATINLRNCTYTKTGYRFYGWATSAADATNMVVAYANQASYTMETAAAVTLYAVWAKQTTVTWELTGGMIEGTSVNPTTTVYYGDNYVAPIGGLAKTRYIFDGWYTAAQGGTEITASTKLLSNEDTTVYAQWVLVGNAYYSVEYYYQKIDGEYPTTASVTDKKSGTLYSVVTENSTEVTGFTFDEENKHNVLSGKIEGDDTLALKLYYSRNRYSVIFNSNGGSGEMSNQSFKFEEQKNLTANAYTKTGYRFLGWATSLDDANATTPVISYAGGGLLTMGAGNINLYAAWEAITYTITFDTDGGTSVSPIIAAYGSAITTPTNPTKVGFLFLNWTKEESPYTIPATMPAENMTLVATWKNDSYAVIFNANSGSGEMANQSFNSGESKALTANSFSKTGYSFAGWATSLENANAATPVVAYADAGTLVMGSANVTLFAIWDANAYTISFNSNGGTAVAAIEQDYGTVVAAPIAPTKTGHSFSGWTLNDAPYTFTTMPAENIILVAAWTINTYNIIFDSNNGSGTMANQPIEYSAETTINLNTFVRTGYTFDGWSRTATGARAFTDGATITMGDSDITLFAMWAERSYTIIFNGNGADNGQMDNLSCYYATTVALTANTYEKIGYSFVGWATTETAASAQYVDHESVTGLATGETGNTSITLYAVWSNVSYNLSYNLNGATSGTAPMSSEIVFGQQITLPAGTGIALDSTDDEETRSFIGWYTDINGTVTEYAAGATLTAPASDVVLYVLWSANYYALNEMIATVDGYVTAGTLPANEANDPGYIVDGDYANETGLYPYNQFDVEALDTAYQTAQLESSRNLPKSSQDAVDTMTNNISAAIADLELLPANYNVKVDCNHYDSSYMDSNSGIYYPACETGRKHSINSLIALCNTIINETEADSIYTAESVNALEEYLYGDGVEPGYYNSIIESNMKLPSQELLNECVDAMAEAYHTMLVLKAADYSQIDALTGTYFTERYGVAYANASSYFTVSSLATLSSAISSVDRTLKKVSQSIVDGYYVTVKNAVDNIVPLTANYSAVFASMMLVPKGTSGYSYPALGTEYENYTLWMNWATANSGNISEVLDTEYLTPRYTPTSLAALYAAADAIVWNVNIFNQNTVDGASNSSSYNAALVAAIDGLVIQKYTVTYMMNDGTTDVYKTETVEYRATVPTVEAPAREGFTFSGWVNAGGTEVTSSDEVLSDKIVYANWTETVEPDVSIEKKGTESTAIIDRENHYIYGLATGVNQSSLNETYLSAVGNGRLNYVYSGNIGTGSKVQLIDNDTNQVVEEYTIIVFGDVNGDGNVNANDAAIARTAVLGTGSAIAEGSPEMFAADLNGDGNILSYDLALLSSVALGTASLNQETGRIG